jgi:hypothetical protein
MEIAAYGMGQMFCKQKFYATSCVSILLLLALTGCGHDSVPATWTRVDKKPVDTAQLSVDKTICNGEMHKANLSAGDAGSDGISKAMMSVFTGCMAQHGYYTADEIAPRDTNPVSAKNP